MPFNNLHISSVAVIGGGPAGLMAAEVLSQSGVRVAVYDAMPSVGRKFLMAGKGGMNITHAEPLQSFLDRYGARREHIRPMLEAFSPDSLREWIHGLGIETFVGSSGRVFPTDMKAAPLLRAWLHRLRENGVSFHMRHQWRGWNGEGMLLFSTPEGERLLQVAAHPPLPQRTPHLNPLPPAYVVGASAPYPQRGQEPLRGNLGVPLAGAARRAERGGQSRANVKIINRVDAVVLALGGGSWPQLGSNAAWVPLLAERGVALAPLRPANCGFDVGWSEHFRAHFAGQPLKAVVISFTDAAGTVHRKQGDCILTSTGIEGGLIYALSAVLRDEIAATGSATIYLDLTPGKDLQRVLGEVSHPRGSRSMSGHLQSRVGIKGVQTGLLRECMAAADFADPLRLAQAIKALPLRLIAPRPLDEAISSAGGVTFGALDQHLMLHELPGVFCAGEMLDWEAPTGGYLLTACFASGRVAGAGALEWLENAGNASK